MPFFNGMLFAVDRKEMLRYAGIRPHGADFPEKEVTAAMREALSLAVPRGIWQILPYDAKNGVIGKDRPMTLEGKNIRRHLSLSDQAAVLAVTVGEALEEASDAHFRSGAYTAGLLLDAAATAMTEQLADQVDGFLQKKMQKEGRMTTWRFSPGYGDWPVTQQRDLCRLIRAEDIGMAVTEHSMLRPRKSVTAVMGISSCRQKPAPEKCKTCGLGGCPFRIS